MPEEITYFLWQSSRFLQTKQRLQKPIPKISYGEALHCTAITARIRWIVLSMETRTIPGVQTSIRLMWILILMQSTICHRSRCIHHRKVIPSIPCIIAMTDRITANLPKKPVPTVVRQAVKFIRRKERKQAMCVSCSLTIPQAPKRY